MRNIWLPPKPNANNSNTPLNLSPLTEVQRSCATLDNLAKVAQTWTHFSRDAYATAPENADRQHKLMRYVDRVLRNCNDRCLAWCSRQTLARLFKFFFLTAVNFPLNAANCSVSGNVSDPSGVKPAIGLSAAKSAVNTNVIVNFLGSGVGFVDVADYDEDGDGEVKEDNGKRGRRGKEGKGDGVSITAARTERLANKTTVSVEPQMQAGVDSKRTQKPREDKPNQHLNGEKGDATEKEGKGDGVPIAAARTERPANNPTVPLKPRMEAEVDSKLTQKPREDKPNQHLDGEKEDAAEKEGKGDGVASSAARTKGPAVVSEEVLEKTATVPVEPGTQVVVESKLTQKQHQGNLKQRLDEKKMDDVERRRRLVKMWRQKYGSRSLPAWVP
ncbi:unnamed protein product [Dibothriocephalus latus]|uniref:Uncharacterized protein n=1 Tax=Dibothriocephalus latus TaxID=60516 RepID=A0A3P7NLM0_DIBLA|nr:unnamed protein product [Dibothriocephalus latus]